MREPTLTNSIENGDNNIQIGQNYGTVNVGYTIEQHQEALKKALVAKAADLERAHKAEQAILRREIDDIRTKLADLEADYQSTLKTIGDLKEQLARSSKQVAREKLEAVYLSLDHGDTTLAATLLREVAENARRRRQDSANEEAEAEFQLGRIAEQKVQWQDAAQHYMTAAKLIPRFDFTIKAAEFAKIVGQYKTALGLADDAFKLAQKTRQPVMMSTALELQALTKMVQGKFKEAEVLARQAVQILSVKVGDNAPEFGSMLSTLGLIVKELGDYSEAEELFRRSCKVIEKTRGKVSDEYTTGLNNLGLALRSQIKPKNAEKVLREAVEIDAKTVGWSHPYHATHLSTLGLVLQDQGPTRYVEAERVFEKALDITEGVFGEVHPVVGTRLNNLAALYIAQARFAQAEKIYRRLIEIDTQTIGNKHPDHATTLSNLGTALLRQGNAVEAEKFFRQAVKIDKKVLGKHHPDYAFSLANLASVLAERGKFKVSLKQYKEAVTILEKRLSPSHPKICRVRSDADEVLVKSLSVPQGKRR